MNEDERRQERLNRQDAKTAKKFKNDLHRSLPLKLTSSVTSNRVSACIGVHRRLRYNTSHESRITSHRFSRKREISCSVFPVRARSARISPITGANLKP